MRLGLAAVLVDPGVSAGLTVWTLGLGGPDCAASAVAGRYRGELLSCDGGQYRVRFVDWGNTERLSAGELAPLPARPAGAGAVSGAPPDAALTSAAAPAAVYAATLEPGNTYQVGLHPSAPVRDGPTPPDCQSPGGNVRRVTRWERWCLYSVLRCWRRGVFVFACSRCVAVLVA